LQETPHVTIPVASVSPDAGQSLIPVASAANVKTGIKIIDDKQKKAIIKNIFFMDFYASAKFV
jgi:hypothetical protein